MKPRSPSAVLLVDGYNIIGSWPGLQKIRDRDSLEAARLELIETLIGYSTYQGFDTQLVFDAHYRDIPANGEVITENLSVYYTDFGQTADTYIEKACAGLRQELSHQRRLIVATSDRAQRLTVVGYGAEWMSAQKLFDSVESTVKRVRENQKSLQQPSSRFLVNSLDEKSRQRLAQLRMGLP